MRQRLYVVTVVGALAALSLTAFARTAPAAQQQEVLQALDRLADAGLRRDVVAMQSLYSDGYFHTNPDGSVMDRAAVFASYRAPTPFTFSQSRRSEERVELLKDCAVVNAIVTLDGVRDGDRFTSRYRITYVLVRNRNRWQIANSHATLLGIDRKPE